MINPFSRFDLQQGFQGPSDESNPYNRYDLQGVIGVYVQFCGGLPVSEVGKLRCDYGQVPDSSKLPVYLIHPCSLVH